MALVAGVDSSTQAVKIVVRDAESGQLVRQGRAAHPEGTEVDPRAWWEALEQAGSGILDGVEAVSVAAQQHGLVPVDDADEVVRPALLWNDTRSARAAADLVEELGGPGAWAASVGSVPLAAFTVTKLRWLAQHEPDSAARTARVLLPHDWLTWRLAGGGPAVAGGNAGAGAPEPTTDRGDASGTGYWSPAEGRYREDLLRLALGSVPALPRVADPGEPVGRTPEGRLLAPGTGDNMAAALALDLGPGDVVVSLGTSGTAFARTDAPTADPSGLVAGFADATGAYLPLVCTLNAARVLVAGAQLLGVELAELDGLALQAAPGAGGLTLLPYLDGERTPNLPEARGSLHGVTRANLTPTNLARAVVEGMLCGLADATDALSAQGVAVRRVLLVGGGARSAAVRALAPAVLGCPVAVPTPGEYVADGAARQAAWVLAGSAEPPRWAADPGGRPGDEQPELTADPTPEVRTAYAAARAALYGA